MVPLSLRSKRVFQENFDISKFVIMLPKFALKKLIELGQNLRSRTVLVVGTMIDSFEA